MRDAAQNWPNLNILIVDDEPLASNRLRALCHRIGVSGSLRTADSGKAAMANIADKCPDVILLDIDMPGLSGIDIAHHCRQLEQSPHIVFTTAHSGYAVQAFRLDATDYLLKPVKQTLLQEALERVISKRRADGTEIAGDHSLWVRDGSTSLQIRSADIERIEAERDYMRLCLPGRSYLIHEPMQSLVNKLPAEIFVRVHRSAIVRRDLIKDIRRKGRRRYVVLKTGDEITVGPRYADGLIA